MTTNPTTKRTSLRRRLAITALSVAAVGGALGGTALGDPAPANAAYNYYGAIALSPSTGATGRALDAPNVFSARGVAIRYCGYADCRVVATFVNGCGAIARSPYYYGYGRAPSLYRAQISALYNAGPGAHIHDWACTSNHS
ncbi:DUF4189 domain-containing protein [Gordonia soli]|nr:DUF4189 domain-containing protein [Gordonia soli]